jgi:peptidoglycan/xylan/chitin deacetylase (PgdA/CDA1 family)
MQNFKIPILMYHSIELMPKTTVMRSLHVPPRRFKFQMWMLKILGYKGLSIRKLKPYLDGEKNGKVFGITFDDGYQNNLFNAAPILKQYNFSATSYIVTDNVGSSNTWDLKKGITQRPLMTETEIKLWLKMGMDIGCHTLSHKDLTAIPEHQAKKEISDCKHALEKMYNVEVVDFCYPFGQFNELVCNIVIDAGYLSATTMKRGKADLKSNRFTLPRIPINHRTLPHLFLAKILTKYEDNR